MTEVNDQPQATETSTTANQNKKPLSAYNLMAIGEAIYDLKLEEAVLSDGNASHRQNNASTRTAFAAAFVTLADKEDKNKADFDEIKDEEYLAFAKDVFNHKDRKGTEEVMFTYASTLHAAVLDKNLWETAVPENTARKAKIAADQERAQHVHMIISGQTPAAFIGIMEAPQPNNVEFNDNSVNHETRAARRNRRVNTGLLIAGLALGVIGYTVQNDKMNTVIDNTNKIENKVDSVATLTTDAAAADANRSVQTNKHLDRHFKENKANDKKTQGMVGRLINMGRKQQQALDSLKANMEAQVADSSATAPALQNY